MLSNLISNKNIRIHAIIWLSYTLYYGLVVIYFFDYSLSYQYVFQVILYRIGDIIFFYVNSFFIFPKFLNFKQFFVLLITCFGGIFAYLGYRYLLDFHIFIKLGLIDIKEKVLFSRFIALSVNQASNFLIFSLGYYFSQRVIQQQKEIAQKDTEIANQKAVVAEQQVVLIKKEKELAEEREKNAILAKEKAQAEMAFLRAQINPHFLYNTLNLIHSKIITSTKEIASGVIVDFSEMMQYATGAKMQEDTVDLGGELKFLKLYLKLFKARNQQSAQIDFEEEGYFSSHRIVPMVIITMVENALKHGLIDDPKNPVIIRASMIDDFFVFMVRNPKNPYPDDLSGKGNTGVGIPNIIKRLNAVYKEGGFTLESEDLKDDYIVTFTINYKIT